MLGVFGVQTAVRKVWLIHLLVQMPENGRKKHLFRDNKKTKKVVLILLNVKVIGET